MSKVIPRQRRVLWWMSFVLAAGFALALIPALTAERWLAPAVHAGETAPYTVRVPQFAGYHTSAGNISGGGILVARGEQVTSAAQALDRSQPQGPTHVIALLLLVCVLGLLFSHHARRSNHGRHLRVQLVNLGLIVVGCVIIKAVMLTTAVSVLVVPMALFAMVPTLALDRVVGLATGTLAALAVSLLVPFDVGVAVMLLVQVAVAGLVIAERPKHPLRATLVAGAVATVCTALTYPLLTYLTGDYFPFAELEHPLRSAWVACMIGPALATVLAVPVMPLYQLLVGEITHGKLVHLEDLSNPLLRQIAEKSPGTWQHSLMMANMAEIAANAIGANGRLVRVGAYYHDLGKSLQPKYFIENLEPGETSPHDKLPPEVSTDAIFAHVTEGIVTARKAGLHARIIDFMHMHHGNGVLEYFWAKCREQGNPKQLSVEHFSYPGFPPQSRETAILAICDAVEAASRTLKNPDTKSIDALVQRIVYGKLHLGQLDESGLSMADLRRVADSLRDTIKHANHGRIEYPWQKAQQDASASPEPVTSTAPRLDSLDRPGKPEVVKPAAKVPDDALADTANQTPDLRKRNSEELALVATAPVDAIEPETRAFVEDAKTALADAAKDLAIAPEPVPVEPTPVARKRAATLPPSSLRKPPTMPPPRRSPTIPPGMLPAITPVSAPPAGLPGVAPLDATLPPPSAVRPPAIVVRESADGVVEIQPSSDAAITQPRIEVDDIRTRNTQPSIPVPLGASEFPPDPTKKQSVDEIEALARRTRATAEVTDDDIEAAIELAPAARRGALGIAKKKPE